MRERIKEFLIRIFSFVFMAYVWCAFKFFMWLEKTRFGKWWYRVELHQADEIAALEQRYYQTGAQFQQMIKSLQDENDALKKQIAELKDE